MKLLEEHPVAYAAFTGREGLETLRGNVEFYEVYGGTILVAEVFGLPKRDGREYTGFFGFHIHEGEFCRKKDGFSETGGHYNPEKVLHPGHAGDLPTLLADEGNAWMAVYTQRFYPEEIIGKTIVIHSQADDFRSQPAGNAGEKIACGEIIAWERQ